MHDHTPDFAGALALATLGISHVDIDLSTARDNEKLEISGSRLFIAPRAYDSDVVVSTSKSTGTVFMRKQNNAGSPVQLEPGTSYEMGAFTEIFLTNTAQALKMIRVYYMTDEQVQPFSSNVILGGVLEARDGGRESALRGETFISQTSAGPSAGEFTHIQLWNPVGSGVVCIVTRLTAINQNAAVNTYHLRSHNAVLVNGPVANANKLIGGVAPTCAVYAENNVASIGTVLTQIIQAVSENTLWPMPEPYILTEGQSILVKGASVNTSVVVAFEWIEELA